MREGVVLKCLQRNNTVMKSPLFQRIFLPNEKPFWARNPASLLSVSLYFPSDRNLNVSQVKAVNVILSTSDVDRVALIHGPPGTGKTTVIAAAVTSVMASANRNHTLWLVAQSNVAVKNIAEKLASVDFFDFKLLVSKDFHFDWHVILLFLLCSLITSFFVRHEHLYGKIVNNLIRSDDFVEDLVAMERLLLGSRVVLCTLSMLSNPRLATIMRIVPPQTIIFDEASQIEIGDYFPLFYRFVHTIQKLVFIGDDKQCALFYYKLHSPTYLTWAQIVAPYGQSDIDNLRSIFEMSHLRDRAVFLDTQCKIPDYCVCMIAVNVRCRSYAYPNRQLYLPQCLWQ
jgi:hypothetical protein